MNKRVLDFTRIDGKQCTRMNDHSSFYKEKLLLELGATVKTKKNIIGTVSAAVA